MNRFVRATLILTTLYATHTIEATHPPDDILRSHLAEAKQLKSVILRMVDGALINAEAIEFILHFKHLLNTIRFGTRTSDGSFVGRYSCNNNRYGTQKLAEIESDIITKHSGNHANTPEWQQLQSILQEAKRDFMRVAEKFRILAGGAKEYMATLIDESCQLRQRPESMLRLWAKCSTLEQENASFEKHAVQFQLFESFCIDLCNFLDDLVNSCPRAQKQFNLISAQRREKWELIQKALEGCALQNPKEKNMFMAHIRRHHLDKLKKTDITTERMRGMITEWQKRAKR